MITWMPVNFAEPEKIEILLQKVLETLQDRSKSITIHYDPLEPEYKFSTIKADVEIVAPGTVRIVSKRFEEGMEFTLEDQNLTPKSRGLITAIVKKVIELVEGPKGSNG